MAFDAGAVYTQMQLDLGPLTSGINQAMSAFDMMGNRSIDQQLKMQAGFMQSGKAATTFGNDVSKASGMLGNMTGKIGEGIGSLAKMTLAFGVAQLGVQSLQSILAKLVNLFKEGWDDAAKFEQSVNALTASIMNAHPEIPWARANEQAKAFVSTSRQMAASIGVTADEVQGVTRAVQEFKIGIDLTTETGKQGFMTLLAGLKEYHAGMDITTSATRELAALFNELSASKGGGGAFTAMATSIREMDPDIKEHIAGWMRIEQSTGQVGYTLAQIAKLMPGAQAMIEAQKGSWDAIKITLQETVNRLLREGLQPVIKDVEGILEKINQYLTDHKKTIQDDILKAWMVLKDTATIIYTTLKAIKDVLDFKIGPMSVGGILLAFTEGAAAIGIGMAVGSIPAAVAKAATAFQMIQKVLLLPVGPLSIGAAILAAGAVELGLQGLAEYFGSRADQAGAAASKAHLEMTEAAIRAKGYNPAAPGTSVSTPGPAAVGPAIIPGGAPPEQTPEEKAAAKAAAEEAKRLAEEAAKAQKEMNDQVLTAQADVLEAQGRTIEATNVRITMSYNDTVEKAKGNLDLIYAAQAKAGALTEDSWRKAFQGAEQSLEEFRTQYTQTMSKIASFDVEIAKTKGELAGESNQQILADEAAAEQEIRDNKKVTLDERIKAAQQIVALTSSEAAEAKKSGVDVLAADQARTDALKVYLGLLEQGKDAEQEKAKAQLSAIDTLQTQIHKFESQVVVTVHSMKEQVSNAALAGYRTWVDALPSTLAEIERQWGAMWGRMKPPQWFKGVVGEGGGGPVGGAGGSAVNVGTMTINIPSGVFRDQNEARSFILGVLRETPNRTAGVPTPSGGNP